jgi:rhodanese-related sulfurtransferase
MFRTVLLAGVVLALAAGDAMAQDSFGGAPAAPATPAAPAYPPAPNSRGTPPRTPQSPSSPTVDPNDPERKDFGVAATSELHSGAMHGPTPSTIPGGQVITTRGVVSLIGNPQLGAKVFDILGGTETIPGAIPAVPAHQAGSFTDQTQQEFGGFLNQVTQGNKETPLVFYCLSTQCWMSYNASLRAIKMGYTNVLWYRGGIEAWKAAGQKVDQARR